MKLHRRFSITVEKIRGYDLHLTARAYALPGEYDGLRARIPMFLEEDVVVAEVSQVSDEKLLITCFSRKNVRKDLVEEKVKEVLAFNEDLSKYHEVIKSDPVLKLVASELRGMRMRGASSLWNAVLISICQQNASFKQGWGMYRNLVYNMGLKVFLEPGEYLAIAPTPSMVLEQGLNKLKEQKLGYRAHYVLEAAKVFVNEELEDEIREERNDEKAYSVIKRVKGLGVYSGRLALLLAHRRYSLTPLDRWTIRILSEVYARKKLSLTEAEKVAKEVWGPWSGLSVYFMTIVLDAEVISSALKRA